MLHIYKHLGLIAVLLLLITGCQNTTTGSLRADPYIIPELSSLQFQYASGQLPYSEEFKTGIDFECESAFSAVILAIVLSEYGEQEATKLRYSNNIEGNSPIQLISEAAVMGEVSHRYQAPHSILCKSSLKIPASNGRVYNVKYQYQIMLGASLHPTPWDRKLHQDMGFIHSLRNFRVLNVT